MSQKSGRGGHKQSPPTSHPGGKSVSKQAMTKKGGGSFKQSGKKVQTANAKGK